MPSQVQNSGSETSRDNANSPDEAERSIIRTKIVAPRYPATLVDRPRLMGRLKLGETRPLTLIEAPAGFGKTTLLAQWRKLLLVGGAKVGWVSLDEDDATVEAALSYVAEALGACIPSVGATLRALLQPGPQLSAETIVSHLVNALAEQEGEIFLILDDYHTVETALGRAISHLVSYAPPNFHLVIGTRRAPDLNLASLRAYDAIVEIGEAELRFSVDEARRLTHNLLPEDLPANQVSVLHRHTEGWAAALQLACISLQDGRPAADLLDRLSAPGGSVGVFLTEDILSRQPEPVVEFLSATSVLERLNADLCDWVAETENASAMLERVRKANLFLTPYENAPGWYRYHGLFRHFLNERLRATAPEQEIRLHRRACDWFSREGLIPDAVRHAIASRDPERAVGLVEDCAMELLQHSHTARLLGWAARLEPEKVRARPRLRLARAWAAALSPHPEEAGQVVDDLEADLPNFEGVDREGIAHEILLIRALVAGIGDDVLTSKRLCEEWLETGASKEPWTMGVAGNLLSYAHLYTGQVQKVKEIQARYRKWRSQAYTAAYGDVLQGIADELQGRLHDAANRFEDAYRFACDEVGEGSAAAAMAAALLADIYFEWGRRDEALALIESRLDVIDEVGLIESAMAAYRPLIRSRSSGPARDVLALIDRLERLGRTRLGGDRLTAMALAERARFLTQRGDFINARMAVRELQALADSNPLGVEDGRAVEIWERVRDSAARLDIATGDPDTAAQSLTEAIAQAERAGRYGRLVNLRSLRAAALLAAGNTDAARADLLAGLAIAAPQGYVETLLGQGDEMRSALHELLAKLSPDGIGPGGPSRGIRDYLNHVLLEGREADASVPRTAEPAGAPQSSDAAHIPADAFTLRQLQILKLLSEGLSNKEIARSLAIGSETVKWHLKAIFSRLEVHNRAQAVIKARQHRLVH